MKALEAILRPRFPTVVLMDSYTRAPFAGRTYVDVFHIPDERYQEFLDFKLDELPLLLEAAGLAVYCDPHSVSWTREWHPEIPPRRIRSARPKARSARPARRRSSSKPRRRSAASSGGGSASRRRA